MDKTIQKDGTSLTLFWPSILIFANRHQAVDTCGLASNYLVIYNSNDHDP